MSTRAQRRANRRNAQLSTGPRTPEGKAASSRNAIKHNLSGTTFVLLPGEDRAAFESLASDYRTEWKPKTPHETFLVAQMVHSRWRLNRIARMEAGVYDAILSMPFAEGNSDEAAIVMSYPLMNDQMLDRLHRYAREADRAYHRAVRELLQYRKQRAQELADQTQAVEKKQPRLAEARERIEPVPRAATAAGTVFDDLPGAPSRPDSAEFAATALRGAAQQRRNSVTSSSSDRADVRRVSRVPGPKV